MTLVFGPLTDESPDLGGWSLRCGDNSDPGAAYQIASLLQVPGFGREFVIPFEVTVKWALLVLSGIEDETRRQLAVLSVEPL
jgi:hypothetical protein